MKPLILALAGVAAGWTASGCYLIPGHRAGQRELEADLAAERVRRLNAESDAGRARAEARERLRAHSLEIDRLRRRVIQLGDVAGALPPGPIDVPATELIPPQALPTTPAAPTPKGGD